MRVQLAVLATAMILLGQPAQASAHEVRRALTDVVEYTCVTTETNETQTIKVRVTLTMPTSTTVGTQLSIGWQGAYAEGTTLRAPITGLDDGTKLYAYAGISNYPGLTSATGVGTLDATTPGEAITLPVTRVDLLTTPDSAGTGTVRPGAINFGTSPTSPAIKCAVQNRDDLTTYQLPVPGNGQGADPDPTDSESPSPEDSETTPDDEETSSSPTSTITTTTTETPAGGADTGAGGEAGPDGRAVMAAGFVIMLAAVIGLRLRRPRRRT
ncbi:hypothetical protein [Nonomuraea insulae]|uniref:Uncharacterized protein n=1 Tax=Nonomuraea insulae TaxID=1616787 RepID=A0ABW1CG38_9ACTN